ncbi:MAG TPA: biopolymer transporter ExbD [Opitutaceae bacterium]
MVTQPLDLQSHLRPSPRSFDVFYFADLALLAVFFMLMGSQFVLAPGMPVNLPVMEDSTNLAQPADVVVSMRGDDGVLFEGGLFPLAAFQSKLAEIVAARNVETVLVRVDRQVTAQGLLDLCAAARRAGAKHVQIAAEEGPVAPQ